MLHFIEEKIRWKKQLNKWNSRNAHNNCHIQGYFDIDRVEIGKYTYGMINAHTYNAEDTKIRIGAFCSIAENVHFVLGEHNYHRVSTFPFDRYVLGDKEKTSAKGDIVIEDDVWIGMNSTILSGVTIHQGAVIAAGSVVVKDVPPYAIFVNGKVKKYRFEPEVVKKLLEIDYSKVDDNIVREYRDVLYSENIDDLFNSSLYQKIHK